MKHHNILSEIEKPRKSISRDKKAEIKEHQLGLVIKDDSEYYQNKLPINLKRICSCGPTHINCLTPKEWLKSQLGVWQFYYETRDIRDKTLHPATFPISLAKKVIELFSHRGELVLDPFVGSGTTIIASNKIGRKCIGIDLNPSYKKLAKSRIARYGFSDYTYITGDSNIELNKIDVVDYIVTSPPYHNILRNHSNGTRKYNGRQYRMGAREGVQYYSDYKNDLGNFEEYSQYIASLKEIMGKCFLKLHKGKYCTIIISDFTINKKEVCVQADIVKLMQDIGFDFCGTTALFQTVKPLYPFGYPYAYKINHHHQNMITFQKPK